MSENITKPTVEALVRGLIRQPATRDLGQRILDGENALITGREALERVGSGCRLDDQAMFVLDVTARLLRSRCVLFHKLRNAGRMTTKQLDWEVSKQRYGTIKTLHNVWRQRGGRGPAIYWHLDDKEWRGNLEPFVREWFRQAGEKAPEHGTIYDSLRPAALARRKKDRERKRPKKNRDRKR